MKTLSAKYSFFTVVLVLWVVLVLTLLDPQQDGLRPSRMLTAGAVVVIIAGVISRFSLRILSRPLFYLQAGIDSVRNGRLERVRVSRTGDEIQYLGETFNLMIDSLAASKAEIREHQELLEDRIRQRTEELERATRKAQDANRAKSEFLANVSHELRTPMNGVLGMMDLVLDDGLPEAQKEQIQTAKRCALSLLTLLDDLLAMADIDNERLVIERRPVSVRSILETTLQRHLAPAQEKNLPILVTIDPLIPQVILADRARIRQVLDKLVDNAVKFTEYGHIAVDVAAEALDGAEMLLRVDVTDTGSGIAPEKLPVIFEHFTQADGSLKRKHGGTGLGLALARKLAELQGGTVTVQSEPGRGSRFRMEVRCGTTAASEPAPRQRATLEPAPEIGVRLLVVEDNAVNRRVAAGILQKAGYHVTLAGDGREALELLEERAFDAVLMDIQMPQIDGLEATRRIRQHPRWCHLPVIAMTAHSLESDRDQCLDAGMDEFVTKPIAAATLLSKLESALAGHSLRLLSAGIHSPEKSSVSAAVH